MTNENFLIVSYFVVGSASLLVGLSAYFWLRAPLYEVSSTWPWKSIRALVQRLFPMGLVLPALLGFVSVSYRGCLGGSYENIISDRSYLIDKSREQLSGSFKKVMWAVTAWCALVAILIAVKSWMDRRREKASAARS